MGPIQAYIYIFKYAIVRKYLNRGTLTVAHHYFQELDDNFGTRPDQHLAFAPLFGVVDAFQSVAQHVHAHHLEACCSREKKENLDT